MVATEKKQKNQLFEEDTVVKVESVSKNIGMVYSGMGPDFRYDFPFSFFLKYRYFVLRIEKSAALQAVGEAGEKDLTGV